MNGIGLLKKITADAMIKIVASAVIEWKNKRFILQ
jgi:hypothetical protein